MVCYEFTHQPVGAVYTELIHYCCATASKMLLTARDREDLDPGRTPIALQTLGPFLCGSTRSKWWPGTELFDTEAAVYCFNVAPGLAEAVCGLTVALFDWVGVGELEDISFLRNGGEPILVTVSHEQIGLLLLNEIEFAQLGADFPKLAASLVVSADQNPSDWAKVWHECPKDRD